MQAYSPAFARVYNLRWANFARQVSPRLLEFYASLPHAAQERTLLDLCCGTGQLALAFLEQGYQVTGIDLSEGMLQYARQNALPYLTSGQARFIQANAANFALERPVGLVVSTFDALNHLESFTALETCFACVFHALKNGGVFIFDLNTQAALRRNWNGISVEDSDEALIVNRGLFDEAGGRAWTRVSGFLRTAEGTYERFEETAYNTVFEMKSVLEALQRAGFRQAHIAHIQDLPTPVEDIESETRKFFVARK